MAQKTKATIHKCCIFNLNVHLSNSYVSQQYLITRQKVMSCSCTHHYQQYFSKTLENAFRVIFCCWFTGYILFYFCFCVQQFFRKCSNLLNVSNLISLSIKFTTDISCIRKSKFAKAFNLKMKCFDVWRGCIS